MSPGNNVANLLCYFRDLLVQLGGFLNQIIDGFLANLGRSSNSAICMGIFPSPTNSGKTISNGKTFSCFKSLFLTFPYPGKPGSNPGDLDKNLSIIRPAPLKLFGSRSGASLAEVMDIHNGILNRLPSAQPHQN